jgi:hypothetical protein
MLGYGTNEGFGDHIDVEAYSARFEAFLSRLEGLAPQASIVALGAVDGARRAREGEQGDCRDGWVTPPKLAVLRKVQRDAALAHGHVFIDGSLAMGGPCGISGWVQADPPLAWPDHVHLRPEGARRVGEVIWDRLMHSFETGVPPSGL